MSIFRTLFSRNGRSKGDKEFPAGPAPADFWGQSPDNFFDRLNKEAHDAVRPEFEAIELAKRSSNRSSRGSRRRNGSEPQRYEAVAQDNNFI